MKARTRQSLIASLAASAALLTSCTTMDDRGANVAGYEGKPVDDLAYIAAVEHLAAGRGVDIKWVNPPKLKTSDD